MDTIDYLPDDLNTLSGVDLGVGQTWTSVLLEPATAGYLWEAVDLAPLAQVELVRMASAPAQQASGEMRVGAMGHVQVKVTGLAAGEGVIALKLVRPWLGEAQVPEAVLEMPLRVRALS